MKLEYLFLDSNKKEEILNYTYKPDSKSKSAKNIQVIKFPTEFEGTDKWTLRLSMKGENKNVAIHLSAVNNEFIKYNPIILANESAEYFNKALYPFANEYERKLRKFLFLKCSLSKNILNDTALATRSDRLIKKIEGMTLSEIYENIFTDPKVVDKIKKAVEKQSSKAHYQKIIDEIPENVLWDKLIGKNGDYIKNNFLNIIDYRNDIMHAHNINYSDFLLQRRTIKKAIKIFDDEINNVIKYPTSIELLETVLDAIDNNCYGLNTNELDSSIQKFLSLLYSSGFFDDDDVKKYLKYNSNYDLEGSPEYEQHTF